MKKTSLIIAFLIPFFISCTDIEEKVDTVKIEKPIDIKNPEQKQEADMLNRLGFDFKDEKIILDINKTSHFFEMLEMQMENKAKEIENKIINADINMTEGMGIHVEGDEIGIDLNKTKNMLQQINILMKDIFLDINSAKH